MAVACFCGALGGGRGPGVVGAVGLGLGIGLGLGLGVGLGLGLGVGLGLGLGAPSSAAGARRPGPYLFARRRPDLPRGPRARVDRQQTDPLTRRARPVQAQGAYRQARRGTGWRRGRRRRARGVAPPRARLWVSPRSWRTGGPGPGPSR